MYTFAMGISPYGPQKTPVKYNGASDAASIFGGYIYEEFTVPADRSFILAYPMVSGSIDYYERNYVSVTETYDVTENSGSLTPISNTEFQIATPVCDLVAQYSLPFNTKYMAFVDDVLDDDANLDYLLSDGIFSVSSEPAASVAIVIYAGLSSELIHSVADTESIAVNMRKITLTDAIPVGTRLVVRYYPDYSRRTEKLVLGAPVTSITPAYQLRDDRVTFYDSNEDELSDLEFTVTSRSNITVSLDAGTYYMSYYDVIRDAWLPNFYYFSGNETYLLRYGAYNATVSVPLVTEVTEDQTLFRVTNDTWGLPIWPATVNSVSVDGVDIGTNWELDDYGRIVLDSVATGFGLNIVDESIVAGQLDATCDDTNCIKFFETNWTAGWTYASPPADITFAVTSGAGEVAQVSVVEFVYRGDSTSVVIDYAYDGDPGTWHNSDTIALSDGDTFTYNLGADPSYPMSTVYTRLRFTGGTNGRVSDVKVWYLVNSAASLWPPTLITDVATVTLSENQGDLANLSDRDIMGMNLGSSWTHAADAQVDIEFDETIYGGEVWINSVGVYSIYTSLDGVTYTLADTTLGTGTEQITLPTEEIKYIQITGVGAGSITELEVYASQWYIDAELNTTVTENPTDLSLMFDIAEADGWNGENDNWYYIDLGESKHLYDLCFSTFGGATGTVAVYVGNTEAVQLQSTMTITGDDNYIVDLTNVPYLRYIYLYLDIDATMDFYAGSISANDSMVVASTTYGTTTGAIEFMAREAGYMGNKITIDITRDFIDIRGNGCADYVRAAFNRRGMGLYDLASTIYNNSTAAAYMDGTGLVDIDGIYLQEGTYTLSGGADYPYDAVDVNPDALIDVYESASDSMTAQIVLPLGINFETLDNTYPLNPNMNVLYLIAQAGIYDITAAPPALSVFNNLRQLLPAYCAVYGDAALSINSIYSYDDRVPNAWCIAKALSDSAVAPTYASWEFNEIDTTYPSYTSSTDINTLSELGYSSIVKLGTHFRFAPARVVLSSDNSILKLLSFRLQVIEFVRGLWRIYAKYAGQFITETLMSGLKSDIAIAWMTTFPSIDLADVQVERFDDSSVMVNIVIGTPSGLDLVLSIHVGVSLT